jgi:hypothetical protein
MRDVLCPRHSPINPGRNIPQREKGLEKKKDAYSGIDNDNATA